MQLFNNILVISHHGRDRLLLQLITRLYQCPDMVKVFEIIMASGSFDIYVFIIFIFYLLGIGVYFISMQLTIL